MQPCGIGSEMEEDEYGQSVETVLIERLAEGLLKLYCMCLHETVDIG